MIIRKKGQRWWVYLEPEGSLEGQVLWELFNKKAQDRIVLPWVREHANSGFRYTNTITKLPGDHRDFTAFRFADETDAILFKMRFEGWTLATMEKA